MFIQTCLKTSLRFTIYNYLIDNINSPYKSLYAGLVSGAFEGLFIITPTDRIKLYNQQYLNTNFFNTANLIRKKYGFMSLYKGWFSSTLRNSITISTRFMVYEYLKKNTNNYSMINGFLSGMISSIISHPVDTIKTNIQTNNKHISFYQSTLDIYKKGNLIAFTKGIVPRVTRVSIAQAIVFSSYEKIKIFLE